MGLGASFFLGYYFLVASFAGLAADVAAGAGPAFPSCLCPEAMSSWRDLPLRVSTTLLMSSSEALEPMDPRRDLMSLTAN